MNIHAPAPARLLTKTDPILPALVVTDRCALALRGGTVFRDHVFADDTPVRMPELVPGRDYAVGVGSDGVPWAVASQKAATDEYTLGGFHFAPGGNATARAGGDATPAINPCSLWDLYFRPACPDPRGMTLVTMPHGGKFWCDIYLLCVNHLENGTSAFGATIADGNDCPVNPATGKPFRKLDYETAIAVMTHHGKTLLSTEEFAWAAIGGTEKTARGTDPQTTSLDAARTSRCGVHQAFGNMWVWGHDGDPDQPRPSLFGGSWFSDRDAGSRSADLGYWPEDSDDYLGARGRSDHLQPA